MDEAILWSVVLFGFYTFLGYPLLLRALTLGRPTAVRSSPLEDWPPISITVPVYNEEHQIAETLESLLALDYPQGKKQILIVSDASIDRTDEIVRSYADRGVELFRQPERRGKTSAEAAVASFLRGDIIVNTDASIRINPKSLKELIAPFSDPIVGLASGRDVSVGGRERDANRGEAGYVGYEMWIRGMETRLGGIVGASGCCYAIRRQLHGLRLPDGLSRDFAAALNTRERGFRPVSISAATCIVPRGRSLRREYQRKVRTITRGIQTLAFKRALLNPFCFGFYSWMLFSHKVCRWLFPWTGLVGLLTLVPISLREQWALAFLILSLAMSTIGAVVWAFAGDRQLPKALAIPAFFLMANVAVLEATLHAIRGQSDAIWEPTRR